MTRHTVVGGIALAGIGAGILGLLARGDLTIDLGIGRSLRPLGPLTCMIDAPRELVFDVISAPYLGRTPQALERKLRVLEQGDDMVLAEHFTDVGPFVTTTLETVRFRPPSGVDFRLVRGPVPHVASTSSCATSTAEPSSRTAASWAWICGRSGAVGARRVASKWDAAVASSLDAVKAEAERRAAHGSRRRT